MLHLTYCKSTLSQNSLVRADVEVGIFYFAKKKNLTFMCSFD